MSGIDLDAVFDEAGLAWADGESVLVFLDGRTVRTKVHSAARCVQRISESNSIEYDLFAHQRIERFGQRVTVFVEVASN